MVEEPTRSQNILDLVITNNPSRVRQLKVLPDISGHDCPIVDLDTCPIRYKQKRQKIPLYKWDTFEADLQITTEVIDCNKDTLSVNELWLTFKKAIHDGTLKHIPHKTCKHKNNLPWITPSIKRLIRQRDRTNIERKRARERNAVGASRLLDQKMRELKKKIQRESRKQYWENVESILSPVEEDTTDFSGMKRFWSFIKHSRRDSVGVGSLKKDGTTISHPRDKANILNMQFQSVFTRDNPDVQVIPMMSSPFATIDDIQIIRAGIKRMLNQLKIHKALGPLRTCSLHSYYHI